MLDRLFRPDRDLLWCQLALEIGAAYHPSIGGDSKVVLQRRQAAITLDIYRHGHGVYDRSIRMRASFVSRNDFWFTIYPRGVISSVRKLLGMQDIEIGHQQFDDEYIIQGSDEEKVRTLFANPQIRFLIESLPAIHFSIADHEHSFWGLPKGIDELCLTTNDDMRDLQELKYLFELFTETLDELERLGTLPA